MDHQFRSVTFGGFHKRDVLDYLEASAQENSGRLRQLREQLEAAEAERKRLAARETDYSEHTDRLERELEELIGREQSLQSELEVRQAELKKVGEELQKAQELGRSLQTELDKLRPDAEAYAVLKDRTAGLELDAHRRAQQVVDQAQEQVEQLHGQVEQWLGKVEREYGQLREQMAGAISRTEGELTEAGVLLERMKGHLERQDSELKALGEGYISKKETKLPIPAPLPIPEE